MINEQRIATYKVIHDAGGNRYKFYCEASGALVCTTGVYNADSPEEELCLAWEQEGKQHFNPCHKCGKLVADVMFNPDVFECVECAPYEADPKYCKTCGEKVEIPGRKCPVCGNPLNYEGGI